MARYISRLVAPLKALRYGFPACPASQCWGAIFGTHGSLEDVAGLEGAWRVPPESPQLALESVFCVHKYLCLQREAAQPGRLLTEGL